MLALQRIIYKTKQQAKAHAKSPWTCLQGTRHQFVFPSTTFKRRRDFQGEWMFVESRPIEENEHKICPCGQTDIQAYFFLENKINGNRTFGGSTCIENIDPRVGKVIAYFEYILTHPIQGTYQGQDSGGLQRFTVKSNTVLVRGAEVVKHLNPQVTKTMEGTWEVLVNHPRSETLIEGQTYDLRLKAKYVRGQLTFTAL